MSGVSLLEVNPQLDREALAASFAASRRLQVRDVLTDTAAEALHQVLSSQTPFGLSVQAADDGPHHLRREQLQQLKPEQRQQLGQAVSTAMKRGDYAFVYSSYPMLDAYLEKWHEGSPHDILLEHINDEPFLQLIRDITGFADLKKADAQATLYGPGQFLAQHDDSHVAEGWKIAYVLNMVKADWRPDFGGYLLFYDESGDVVQGFRPRFNALNLFAVPQEHSVSYVPPFAPPGRFAITGRFRDR